ncbi:transcriptional regulator [Natronolimnobius sp. AArcel1]|uniref:DUF7344 domain-containing protein n=1 Tax=Natronolimnobius sp. AArcel1 TaxID=1679093 RepID=UPI0013EBAF7A|nr:transcriptional regulator [Natronolimnobius sp. AArcel1]NGM70444.1 transcriptional regulator [Natronolimnobius sp. AArcel1]
MTIHSPRDSTIHRERATLDDLFEVLSKPIRRCILTMLADANPRDEPSFSPRDFTSTEQREDIMARLHHTDLPKLDDAGFIEWEPDSKTITRGPRFDEVEPLITLLTDNQDELPAGWP